MKQRSVPPKVQPEARPVDHAGAPQAWLNWRAMLDGSPPQWKGEFGLYSDAWFTAEARGRGPYSVINPVPHTTRLGGSYEWKPGLILRVEGHVPAEVPNMSITSADHYHGGWLPDEIAALLSLELGVRIVAGPMTRDFADPADPLGRPRTHSAGVLPSLPPRSGAPVIPRLFEDRCLQNISLFDRFSDLSRDAATALVQSARSYQQALLLADSAPELAWLLLVSSIEIAAGQWKASTVLPREQLQRSLPNLISILELRDDPTLVDQVAGELHKLLGSTGKFLGFCKAFKPEPPANRPSMEKFDYDAGSYDAAISTIYRHRSRALHAGIPFPRPMCEPPVRLVSGEAPTEWPGSIAAASNGVSWLAEEFPMYLHTFEHIARGALLAWWELLSIPQDSLSKT